GLLLLDEPTAHLDPAATRAFLARLSTLPHPMVIVEHKLEQVVSWIDRVVVLAHGGIVPDGPPGDVCGDRADELERLGVWLPPATRLARSAGLPASILTLENLIDAVRGDIGQARAVLDALPPPRPPMPVSVGSVHDGAPPPATEQSAAEPAVSVSHLSYVYAGGDAPALDEVSLRVPARYFVAIVGGNGSGKTTLALHLAGILDPPRGSVRLFGRDVATLAAVEIAQDVGYVFQNPEHQFVSETVLDEVAYTLRARRSDAGRPGAAAVRRRAPIPPQPGSETALERGHRARRPAAGAHSRRTDVRPGRADERAAPRVVSHPQRGGPDDRDDHARSRSRLALRALDRRLRRRPRRACRAVDGPRLA
ncbi:MAG: ATP-binding cassette domain-containing protein, partial [Armatimonadetes bacterium]|nr:ATP-binding cassette domain-containing protein [Armatimonadota bacterium]